MNKSEASNLNGSVPFLHLVKMDTHYSRSRLHEISAWLVCSLSQTACQQGAGKKKVLAVSWVIIKHETERMNSRGCNYLVSSGSAVASLILIGLHG